MLTQADISLLYQQASIKFQVSDFSGCLSEVSNAYLLAYESGLITDELSIESARLAALCHSGMGNFEEAIVDYNSIKETYQSFTYIDEFAASLMRYNMYHALDYMLTKHCRDNLRASLETVLRATIRDREKNRNYEVFTTTHNFYLGLLLRRSELFSEIDSEVERMVLHEATISRYIEPELIIKRKQKKDESTRQELHYKIHTLEFSLRNDTEITKNYFSLGLANSALKNYVDAIKYYSLALSMLPNRDLHALALLISRGEAYYKNKEFDKSLEDYDSVLQLFENSLEDSNKSSTLQRQILLGHARTYIALGNFPAANKDLAQLMTENLSFMPLLKRPIFTSLFPMDIFQFALSSRCDQKVRDKVQEMFVKKSLVNGKCSSTDVCNFYLSLCLERDKLFQNEADIPRIILDEADRRIFSHYAEIKYDLQYRTNASLTIFPLFSDPPYVFDVDEKVAINLKPKLTLSSTAPRSSLWAPLVQTLLAENKSAAEDKDELTVDMLMNNDEYIPDEEKETEKSAFAFMN
jgi:tetratricopeptide (TPR) repeat protein